MVASTRTQNRYDHRLRELVRTTQDVSYAVQCGVPRSTARGWLTAPSVEVVTLGSLNMDATQLQREVLRLQTPFRFRGCFILILCAFLAFLTIPARGSEYPKSQPDTEWIFKCVNGKDYGMSVFLPEGYETGESFPAYVVFHGGGWGAGSASTHYADCAYWSSRGMIAVTVDYRLKNRDNVEVPLECVKDAKTSIRFLRKNAKELKVDPNRIAVAGASAGGQMAAATAMIDSEETNDELFSGVSCIPNAVILYNPWFRCPDALSPPKHVKEELAPIIMFIGDKDPVPVSDLLAFRADLMKAGNRADLHVGLDGRHGFCNGRNKNNPYSYWSIETADHFLVEHGILSGAAQVERPANLRACRWEGYTKTVTSPN